MNTSNLVEIMILIYGIGIFIYLAVRSFALMRQRQKEQRINYGYYQREGIPPQYPNMMPQQMNIPPQQATKGKNSPNFNNFGQNPQIDAVRQIASNDNLSVYDRIGQIKKVLGIK